MSQLKRDTQMTLVSRIPVMLLSFLSVVLLTRLLGPEGNGVYTFTYASLNLLITIIGFQLDGSLTFFLSNKGYENNKVISTIGLLFLLQSFF
ncbi:MAG: oligosaccharide flippase family protein [Saprospiraceae bacterium]|uniref:Oligosaccharide flippase family protein n=1 Tax=Candidatus Opimibacter skivensis TaxID=2982028 RepID=A0A9D7SWE7_9BACT|nr:oligosaccharide flippase family protein [Candidatus Opimibacter skivensis]